MSRIHQLLTYITEKVKIMKKSTTATALILTTALSFPLQATVTYKYNSVILNQFIQLDTDGDGLITRQEIAAQPELTRWMEVSVAGGFEMGDFNSDGFLDWPEFLANEEEIPAE